MTYDKGALSGYDFLIVEDEALQAQHISHMLHSMGGTVSDIAATYEQARNAVDRVRFDCAILDVNLGGTLSLHLAELLRMRDKPFVICTGYGDEVEILPGGAGMPRLGKPVEQGELRQAVLQALLPSRDVATGKYGAPPCPKTTALLD